jgi:pterin-4a-carbinolamine dehydratase
MKMSQLHEAFIEKAQRRMDFGALPIEPKEPEAPLMAVERWREVDGALYKTYKFRRQHDRNDFVMQLLSYEATTEHNAEIIINQDEVSLRLQTKDLGKATELDKEYARYADVLFKGLVYSPSYGP